jgi:hypothetical protein
LGELGLLSVLRIAKDGSRSCKTGVAEIRFWALTVELRDMVCGFVGVLNSHSTATRFLAISELSKLSLMVV